MKKISTLALALIAMGSLSMPASAQVTFEPVSTPTLESGWYQMRQVVGVSRNDISATAPRYVYSAETAKDGKYYFASDAAQKSDATAFVYVDNTDGKYAIKSINGKWGDFVAISSNTKPATYDITQVDKNNPTQYRVGTKSYWEDWQNWNYIAGSQNSGNARFEFSKVNPADNYDVYSVVATGDFNPKTMQITVTNTLDTNKGTQTVYNGGSFFFTKGATVTQDNFTVVDNGTTGYSKTVKFDATAKTLVVEYTLDDKENKYTTLLTSSKADIAKRGVGLPKAESKVRTTFDAAISAFESEQTYEKYVTLSEAYTAYLKSSEVQMPEDGKVYVITNVQNDGTCYYFSYKTENRLKAVSDKSQAAQFVCRVVNDKYVFVNVEDGKYLLVAAVKDQGTNNGKGYIEKYDAQWADLTLSKNSMFSCFNIGGKRATSGNKQNGNFIVDKANGAFNGWDMTERNNDANTTAFKLEEVSYPNTVTFNTVSDVEGVSNLATFSAPFATVVPEGVTAYYVETTDRDESTATMKAIEAGKAIPANAGVILASTTGDEATMIPATTETAAELTGNKLGNSAGADKTIAEGDNAYILANGANGTAFYKGTIGSTLKANKAYLTLNVAGGEQAISMNFGGNVTGINQIVNAEQNNAPVYDLTGRRVVRTVKGGLYIKGGNKFIAR